MELSKQVVNLELAKKLKELNCKQESLFYWCKQGNKEKYNIFSINDDVNIDDNDISAFTVAELGEMLPHTISVVKKEHTGLVNEKDENVEQYFSYQIPPFSRIKDWSFGYSTDDEILSEISANTEADARCLMLIYLLENKLIEL